MARLEHQTMLRRERSDSPETMYGWWTALAQERGGRSGAVGIFIVTIVMPERKRKTILQPKAGVVSIMPTCLTEIVHGGGGIHKA